MIHSWVRRVEASSDCIDAQEAQIVRQHVELSIDYVVRAERLRTAMEVLKQREEETKGHYSVPFDTIRRHFRIFLSEQTRENVLRGVKHSLSNFVKLLSDTCEISEVSDHMAPRRPPHELRLEALRARAADFLWEALDVPDLSCQSIRKRAVAAVHRLWNTHAVCAIEDERVLLSNACSHIESLRRFCDLFVEQNKASPWTVGVLLKDHRRDLEVARKVISGNRHIRSEFLKFEPLEYITSEIHAFDWFAFNATECRDLCSRLVERIERLVCLPNDHICWHMITVVEEQGDGPSLQAPSTQAPFTTRLLLGSPVERCSKACATPVVRLCRVLVYLIEKNHLRLEMIGLNYLSRITAAEYAKFELTLDRIFQEIIKPTAERCSLPFDCAWYASLTCVRNARAVAEEGLESLDQEAQQLLDTSTVSDDATEENREHELGSSSASHWVALEISDDMRQMHEAVSNCSGRAGRARTVESSLSSVAPDACLDFVILDALDRALSGSSPTAHKYVFSTADLQKRVRHLCPPAAVPVSDTGLQQRIAYAFKLLVDAFKVVGVNSKYVYVRDVHAKQLQIENAPGSNDLSKAMATLGALLRHLEIREPLPPGMSWKRPKRTKRRLERNGV
ncbi:MAG: hypothetical protein CMI16_02845 [Opitutaceae bacterium]|nr:hypothetical protein [Opitutaceae bacterium]